MQRDNLDFKNMSVSKLFTKQLFPTLLGMVSSALFTVVDGIFVGRGEYCGAYFYDSGRVGTNVRYGWRNSCFH